MAKAKSASTDAAADEAPKVELRLHSRHDHSPDQYEVLVACTYDGEGQVINGRRVAFVCVRGPGDDVMPLNFLPSLVTGGLTLTRKEQIAIAKTVRDKMAVIEAAIAAEQAEFDAVINGA